MADTGTIVFNNTGRRNTLMFVILAILILITAAMIYNFYGMRERAFETAPDCVGSEDIDFEKKRVSKNRKFARFETMSVENSSAKNPDNSSSSSGPANSTGPKTKFIVFHMQGCGPCHDVVKNIQNDGMTKFDKLKSLFKNRPDVEFHKYQYGKDPEAAGVTSFPTIVLVKKDGSKTEYSRDRTVESMAKFIEQNS